MVFELDGPLRLVVRPSGTEPKTKAYLEYVVPAGDDIGTTRREASAVLEAAGSAVTSALRSDSTSTYRGSDRPSPKRCPFGH